jgi:hypothetical protein
MQDGNIHLTEYHDEQRQQRRKKARLPNSTYPKGGVSCSKDSFVVNQTLVFQIKFCGKSPALRVAAKRYASPYDRQC